MEPFQIGRIQIEFHRVVGLQIGFFRIQRKVGRPAAVGFRIGIGGIGNLRQVLLAGVDKPVAIGIGAEQQLRRHTAHTNSSSSIVSSGPFLDMYGGFKPE